MFGGYKSTGESGVDDSSIKLFGIEEIKRGRGISNELEYMQTVRKHDNRVLMYNKLINSITRFIEAGPFAMNNSVKEYWEYNLTRADIRIPGGNRVYKPTEFHAIIVFITGSVLIVDVAIFLFANYLF